MDAPFIAPAGSRKKEGLPQYAVIFFLPLASALFLDKYMESGVITGSYSNDQSYTRSITLSLQPSTFSLLTFILCLSGGTHDALPLEFQNEKKGRIDQRELIEAAISVFPTRELDPVQKLWRVIWCLIRGDRELVERVVKG